MAARSIANGEFLTLMYVQSANRPADWYRVALDRTSRALSCDCPIWTFNRTGNRTCKHTDFVALMLSSTAGVPTVSGAAPLPPAAGATTPARDDVGHPSVQAILTQFPGIGGTWRVEERRGRLGADGYRIAQISLVSGNGDEVEASIAFVERRLPTDQARLGEVAVRAGYCLALELAHRRGIRLDVRPPSHYSTGSTAAAPRERRAPRLSQQGVTDGLPAIGLDQILRVAGTPAAGRTPVERAEGTLRLMLGDQIYQSLMTQGYLDVPSVRYADRQRVYRLRRDPNRREDKRIRVFEQVGTQMTYVKDFCVVRASPDVPEADHFLSKWLGLLSSEQSIIGVVGPHNVFEPYSDDYGRTLREPVLPVWQDTRQSHPPL